MYSEDDRPVFSLGKLKLGSNLFLSPLAGYTNLPFRLVIREIGGVDLCTTDLVNARSLLEKNPKAIKLIETNEADSPLSVQLFGGVPEEMRDAAAYLESIGMASVDVNMGCPVPKVTKTGGGASMMTELPKTQSLIRAMTDAISIPVTAKMRLGWDEENLTAPDLAKALEDAGVAAIFVHGRTRAQGFDGTVNLDGIRKVVEAVDNIPVIGNGDVTTVEAASVMIEKTGCAGVSVGRGAFYNPWIFSHISDYLKTGKTPPEPSFEERIRVLRRHYELMVEVFGEDRGSVTFRKVAPWYAKRFGPVKPFNQAIVRISTRADFERVLGEYLEWRKQFTNDAGELLPRYQLSPMVASFMQEEDEHRQTQRKTISVPKGPIEVW
ncbi:MAG: tRNA dihydrouridine synthase DusB [Opitutae bacterium]|nr:tRNA dihydrouridine synthase DusB [Opitutae bacterium]